METQLPTATSLEDRQLRIVFENWDALNPTQRAICITILRGKRRPVEIAEYICVSVEVIHAQRPTIRGVLYDPGRDMLWLK